MSAFIEIVPAQTIVSPCINVCDIDGDSGLCAGCRRTIEEIARWTSMTPVERDAIMAALPGR